jgi:hypothetical protein
VTGHASTTGDRKMSDDNNLAIITEEEELPSIVI